MSSAQTRGVKRQVALRLRATSASLNLTWFKAVLVKVTAQVTAVISHRFCLSNGLLKNYATDLHATLWRGGTRPKEEAIPFG